MYEMHELNTNEAKAIISNVIIDVILSMFISANYYSRFKEIDYKQFIFKCLIY